MAAGRAPGALEPLFAPRGIAVIGASSQPGKLGFAMARSLATFPGPVLLVNDRRPDPGAGVHASVAEAALACGAIADLAVLCVPAGATAAALAGAASAGVRAAVVCAGGFAEAGGPGMALHDEVAAVVAATGIRLLGPNTSGFFVPGGGLVASFVPGAERIPAGSVSLVAASGGILHTVAFLLGGAGVGLHLGVGVGNALDVTSADVLEHLAAARAPGPVALHVEGVVDGRRLVDAVARLTPDVAVVALVVGRTDVGDLARSHTGALTPAWRTARAALAAAGAVLVDDERDMVDALVALEAGRLPLGRRTGAEGKAGAATGASGRPGVGLVSGQAGPAVLCTDRLKTAGIALPPVGPATAARLAELLPLPTHRANPVDTGRPGPGFPEVLVAVGADPAVDVLAVYALLEPGALDLPIAVAAARERLGSDGPPVVVATGGLPDDVADARRSLRHSGVAAYDGVAGLVTGVRALVDDARARTARAGADAPVRLVLPEPFAVPAGEDEGKELLAWLGIGVPERAACDGRADAEGALLRLRAPVVAKMLEPVVLHKARVGGVRLGVWTPADLDAALDALDAAGARRYLIEETAPPGLDLIVGARRDPAFGPMVLVGLGGDRAEDLDAVALRPAPLSQAAAAGMLDELFGGARPDLLAAPGVTRALCGAIANLGALLTAVEELDEIEVNPMRATVDGRLVALDAVVRGRAAEPPPETAIAVQPPALAARAAGQGDA